jgi:hypothetical protein
MSTIKATNIQPQSDSDPLVFSTNATERMRIPSSGGVSITGGAAVSGGLSITGGAAVSGGIQGTLTTAAQPNITSLGTLSSLNVSAFGSGNVAPLPTSSSDVGQVIHLRGVGSYTLPSGGTWFYFGIRWNTTSIQNSASGVAAGGTLVFVAASGQAWEGFVWRIS